MGTAGAGRAIIAEYLDETLGGSSATGACCRARSGAAGRGAPADELVQRQILRGGERPAGDRAVLQAHMPVEQGGGPPDTDVIRAARHQYPLSSGLYRLAGADARLARRRAAELRRSCRAAHLSAVDYLGDVPWNEDEAAKPWYARVKSRPSFRPLLARRWRACRRRGPTPTSTSEADPAAASRPRCREARASTASIASASPVPTRCRGQKIPRAIPGRRRARRHGLAGGEAERRAIRACCGPTCARSSCSASTTAGATIRWRSWNGATRGAISVYAQGDDYHDVIKAAAEDAGALADRAGRRRGEGVRRYRGGDGEAAARRRPGWAGRASTPISSRAIRLVAVSRRDLHHARPAAGRRRDRSLRLLPRLPRRLPDRGLSRALPARCAALHFVSHHRAQGPDRRANFATLMGNRIYGCDDCLAVCPWNKFAQQGREAKLAARADLRAPARRVGTSRRRGVPCAVFQDRRSSAPAATECAERSCSGERGAARRGRNVTAALEAATGVMASLVLLVGLGYCARHYAGEFGTRFDRVIGTTRGACERRRRSTTTHGRPRGRDAHIRRLRQARANFRRCLGGRRAAVSGRTGGRPRPCPRGPRRRDRHAPRLRSVVFLSTLGVYGDSGGAWIDETTETIATLARRGSARIDAELAWRALGTTDSCRSRSSGSGHLWPRTEPDDQAAARHRPSCRLPGQVSTASMSMTSLGRSRGFPAARRRRVQPRGRRTGAVEPIRSRSRPICSGSIRRRECLRRGEQAAPGASVGFLQRCIRGAKRQAQGRARRECCAIRHIATACEALRGRRPFGRRGSGSRAAKTPPPPRSAVRCPPAATGGGRRP